MSKTHSTAMGFFSIALPLGLLPVLGPLEQYMTPTLDTALLSSSRVGTDLGRTSVNSKAFAITIVNS